MKLPQRQSSALIVTFMLTAISPIGRAAEGPVSDAGALEEVIVTADRRTERPLDVAGSISVISAADIEKLHVSSLTDLAAAVPGLVIASGGSTGATSIVLRGLPALSSGTLIATLVDDVAVGSSAAWTGESAFQLDLLPYDIERIEVLRGPQGTLYGANSMGGVLKYVTRDPNLTASEAQLGGDVFDIKGGGSAGVAARGAWSAPLIDGTLAVRASLYLQETPGYVENPLRGFIRENSLSQYGGRVVTLWQPLAALQVRLQGIYQKTESNGNEAVSAEQLGTKHDPYYHPGAWLGDLTYPHVVPEPLTSELKLFSATIDWNMSFANLISVTGYSDKQVYQAMDFTQVLGYLQPLLDPNVTSTLNRSRFYAGTQKASQEVRIDSRPGRYLEWLAGVYYCHEKSSNEQYSDALDSQLNLIPALNPFFAAHIPSTYAEAAVFGTLTYRVSQTFDLTGGLRWLKNKQYVENDILPNEVLPTSSSVARSQEQPKTYSLAARYRPQPETMVYLRVASGYRPGTPNQQVPGYPEIPLQTHSDTTVNYEIGVKSELFDRRASLEVDLFDINWSDMQIDVNTPDNSVSYAINAGRVTSKGLEFAANYWPTDAFHLGINSAYTDAYATEAVPAAGILLGTRLPASPKWTAAAMLDCCLWTLGEWSSRLSATFRYMAAQYTSLSTAVPASWIPGYSWVDVDLRATKGRYDIALYAKNLFDKRAFNTGGAFTAMTAGPGAPVPPGFASPSFIGVPIQPRVVGLSVTLRL